MCDIKIGDTTKTKSLGTSYSQTLGDEPEGESTRSCCEGYLVRLILFNSWEHRVIFTRKFDILTWFKSFNLPLWSVTALTLTLYGLTIFVHRCVTSKSMSIDLMISKLWYRFFVRNSLLFIWKLKQSVCRTNSLFVRFFPCIILYVLPRFLLLPIFFHYKLSNYIL